MEASNVDAAAAAQELLKDVAPLPLFEPFKTI